MSQKIRVLIADDVEETRKNIITLLDFEKRIEVVGQASDGKEALELTEKIRPDLVLMDINMPVMDGLKATEKINEQFPDTLVIIMSVQGEREYFKKAMYCGAKEYIVKPFSIDALLETIIKTYDKEQNRKKYIETKKGDETLKKAPEIVAVYSTKGGVGKTTIAVNTAISLAKLSSEKVAIVDLDLQFGDVAVMLDITPTKTIVELIDEIGHLNSDILSEYMIEYMKGVDVLAAPLKPEYAEYISSSHIEKILAILKEDYQYVIIDSVSDLSDVTLAALDNSDQILFVSTMNLPTIKNVKLGLEIMNTLHYHDEKVKIVLNKTSKHFEVKITDVEEILDKEVSVCIPEDSKTVIPSANKGYPFMRSRAEAKISKCVKDLANLIIVGKDHKLKLNYSKRLFRKKKLGTV